MYELWMSSENEKSYKIVRELQLIEKSFTNNETLLKPHYYLWYCLECK